MKNYRAFSKQSGVILFIALVILVFMSISGLALMRSIDVGGDVAGNFATRQASLTASDRGLEQARTWVSNNQGSPSAANVTLLTDNDTNGYKASRRLDAGGNDVNFFSASTWTSAPVARMPSVPADSDSQGNIVQYLIDRQCQTTGKLGVQSDNNNGNTNGVYNYCLNFTPESGITASSECGDGGACDQTYVATGTAPLITYYRIVVRTTGPRNAVSYVQTLVAQQVPSGSGG